VPPLLVPLTPLAVVTPIAVTVPAPVPAPIAVLNDASSNQVTELSAFLLI